MVKAFFREIPLDKNSRLVYNVHRCEFLFEEKFMDKDAKLIKQRISDEDCRFLDIDRAELDGNVYHALIECDEDGVPFDDGKMVVEKECEKKGRIELVPISGEELDKAMEMMIKRQGGINAIGGIIDENGCFEVGDENGNLVKFELIDSMECNGVIYHAVIPADSDNDAFVVLKQIPDKEGLLIGTIDDDDEYEKIGNLFLERFADEDEADDEDE